MVGQLEKVVQHGADGVVLVAVPLVVREPLLGWHVAAAPDSDVAGRSRNGLAHRLLRAAALSKCARPSLDSTGWCGAAARRLSWRSGPCALTTCTPRSRRCWWVWLSGSAPAC